MPSMQLRRDDVIVGVDTHKDNHVAVAIDGFGGRLGDIVVPTTIAGFEELLAFCLAFVGSAGRLIGLGWPVTYAARATRSTRSPVLHGPRNVDSQGRTTPSMPSTLHASSWLGTGCRHPRPPTARSKRSGWSRSPTTVPFKRGQPR